MSWWGKSAPADSSAPPSVLLTPPQWDGPEWDGQIEEKLVAWDNDSLMSEAKWHAQAKWQKEFIHHFPTAGRCFALSKEAGFNRT